MEFPGGNDGNKRKELVKYMVVVLIVALVIIGILVVAGQNTSNIYTNLIGTI